MPSNIEQLLDLPPENTIHGHMQALLPLRDHSHNRIYLHRGAEVVADDEAAVSKKSTGRTESDVDEAESGCTDGRVRADRIDGAVTPVALLLLDGTNALADDDTRCATNARRANFIVFY